MLTQTGMSDEIMLIISFIYFDCARSDNIALSEHSVAALSEFTFFCFQFYN